MNRIVEFRGRKENGQWAYGDLNSKPIHHECCILESGVINHSVDRKTIGQFTGIFDSHDEKIFEGDIVYVSNKYLPVVFENGCFYTPIPNSKYRLGGWDKESILVVGNIHDTPSFLEQPALGIAEE